jgi:chorismate synthase
MLRYLTAGESHGKGLIGILEGLPSGLKIDVDFINEQLRRRKQGYGRGPRMKIESDTVCVISGLRKGETIGSPISILIENKDYKIDELHPVICPRPGHADLAGFLKYDARDIRSVLERASARETAARTALGAIAKLFLEEFGIEIGSHVVELGGVIVDTEDMKFQDIFLRAEKSPVRCISKGAELKMISKIKKAIKNKDTMGGTFEVIAVGLPVGLGSYIQWDKRLDARLAGAIISIQGVKGVEIGMGFRMKGLFGSEIHDAIYHKKDIGFYRKTNRCGGIEGGISNGEPLVVRGFMKPIATLSNPLPSVDVFTKKTTVAAIERSDVCVVPSTGIVAEAVVALELAGAFTEKFGSDSLRDIKNAYRQYVKRIK